MPKMKTNSSCKKRFELTNRKIENNFHLDNTVDKNLNVVINWLIYYDNLSKNNISKLLAKSSLQNI